MTETLEQRKQKWLMKRYCISREEVKNVLRRMKKGKAVGPDELPVEVLEVHGRDGDKVFDQIVQQTIKG